MFFYISFYKRIFLSLSLKHIDTYKTFLSFSLNLYNNKNTSLFNVAHFYKETCEIIYVFFYMRYIFILPLIGLLLCEKNKRNYLIHKQIKNNPQNFCENYYFLKINM